MQHHRTPRQQPTTGATAVDWLAAALTIPHRRRAGLIAVLVLELTLLARFAGT